MTELLETGSFGSMVLKIFLNGIQNKMFMRKLLKKALENLPNEPYTFYLDPSLFK